MELNPKNNPLKDFRLKYGAGVAVFVALLLLATLLTLFSCDPHTDLPDVSAKVCHVLCSDGSVMTAEEFQYSGKTASGVVFYISSDAEDGIGYAVALKEAPAEAFADSLGVSQGTSCDLEAHDGNSNTFAMYDESNVSSPIAQEVFANWTYGQSSYIPSVAQMRVLLNARSLINPIIEELGGTVLPVDTADCWYWTSTEVSGQSTAKAWLYSLGSGSIQETPKNERHKVRPIITLYE